MQYCHMYAQIVHIPKTTILGTHLISHVEVKRWQSYGIACEYYRCQMLGLAMLVLNVPDIKEAVIRHGISGSQARSERRPYNVKGGVLPS